MEIIILLIVLLGFAVVELINIIVWEKFIYKQKRETITEIGFMFKWQRALVKVFLWGNIFVFLMNIVTGQTSAPYSYSFIVISIIAIIADDILLYRELKQIKFSKFNNNE